MRRSASEIINDLEMRVAHLEKRAGNQSLPEGFEGFGFGWADEEVEYPPSATTKDEFEKKFNRGSLSRGLDPSRFMKKWDFVSGMIQVGNRIAFIYADVQSSLAEKIGSKYFRNLKGKRQYTSDMPLLHDYPVVVGTKDGKITLVKPPEKVKRERAINPRDEAIQKAKERSLDENLGLQISTSRKRDEVKVYSPRTQNPTGRQIKLVVSYKDLDRLLDQVSSV